MTRLLLSSHLSRSRCAGASYSAGPHLGDYLGDADMEEEGPLEEQERSPYGTDNEDDEEEEEWR